MLGQEKTRELLEQELERLRNENHRLKEELTSLKEKETNQSFKEKYAVRILESLPDMLTVFNHEGTGIGVVSSEETNHVGVPNSAFAGMHMRDMIPEEAYHNVYNNLQKVIATGKGSTAHHELDVNGAHHYYENRIFPLDEEYVLIMCRDISERVVTQKNLEVFKRVLDKVSDSILAASTDGTLVYANKQFIEEYGVKGELGVQKVYDLPVSLHTKEIFEKRVQEIRDNGGSMGYHARYTRVGEVKERVHQVSTFIMEDGQEEIVWFFTQDITDVIKNRDELRELNYLLDAILNNIPVYMFVKDPEDDFRYLYWNKALANHSKIPASRALGRTDFEIFPERSDAEKFHQDDLELMRTGERLEMQETYVTAAGETRIVQTLKTHIPLVGRVPLIIGISWDITNVQNIEQELIQARIKAEQSDRLKSAFLANMSHEIRTPLNAIVGFSRLMTTTDNREDEKLYSEIINQNSDVLLQLINDILDLSKIEAGTFEYIKQPMDLGEMCRNVYEIHKGRVQEGVTLTLDNENDSLMINEDKNRILQLITNLITNAIKFTYEGEIHFGFKLKKDYIDFYEKVLSDIINHPNMTIDEAAEKHLREEFNDLTDEQLCNCMPGMMYADLNVRFHYRELAIRALVDSGLKVNTYGEGYNYIVCEHPENIIQHGSANSQQCLDNISQAKISLNVMPWFKKGAHDRVFNSCLNGAVCLTDSSSYLDEIFTDGKDILFYDLNMLKDYEMSGYDYKVIEPMIKRVRELLMDDTALQSIADNAYELPGNTGPAHAKTKLLG